MKKNKSKMKPTRY